MVRCPNCGQETSGGDCQWCNYPILKGRQEEARRAKEARKQEAIAARRARIAEKRAEKQAAIDAREKARQEAEEAIRAKMAERQAVIDAREKARQEAEKQSAKEAARVLLSQIDSDQAKHLEECLKELKNTREELGGGKIGAEEAIQRLRDISERISK